MIKLHDKLCEKYSWYNKWHQGSDISKIHWIIMLLVALFVSYQLVIFATNELEISISSSSAKSVSTPLESYSQLASLTNQMLNKTVTLQNASDKRAAAAELESSAKARKQAILQAMETDPASVIAVALDSQAAKKLPASVQKLVEKPVTLSGSLDVLHSDDFQNPANSTVEYTLKDSKGNSHKLHFAGYRKDEIIDGLSTGVQLDVNGVAVDDQVAIGTGPNSYKIKGNVKGESVGEGQVKAAITKRVAVIVLTTAPGVMQHGSMTNIRDYFFGPTNSVASFYNENSYGKWNMTGDVFGYYYYPVPAGANPCLVSSLSTVFALAAPDGFVASNYDKIGYVSPCSTGVSSAGVGGPYFQLSVLPHAIHELGHTFGLQHASTLHCADPATGARVTISAGTSSCTYTEYGDPFSPMGSGNKHHKITDKGKMNYLDSANSQHIWTSGVYTIAQQEAATTGLQALYVDSEPPRTGFGSTIQYPVQRFILEYRQYYGSYGGPDLGGVDILYSNYLLDASPDGNFVDSAIKLGQTFTDPVTGIQIKTLSLTPTAATVQVTYPSQSTCIHANPTVTVSPAATWIDAGTSTTYTVSIKNNDNSACGVGSFGLTATLPAGMVQAATQPISINPGTTVSTTVTLTAQAGIAQGVYQITEKATNNSAAAFNGSVIANLNINAPVVVQPPPPPPPVVLPPPPPPVVVPPPPPAKGHINLSPTSFAFTGVSFGPTPTAKSLTIGNTGGSALNWSGTTSQPWCQLTPSSGTTNAGSSSNVSVTVSPPTNVGSFNCQLTISDSAADNSPQQANLTYTVTDGTKPATSITTPTTNTIVAGTTSVTATASDNVGITKLELYINDTLIGSSVTSPYTYSWNTNLVVNGSVSIYSKAYDAAGNTAASSTVNVTVNNVIAHIDLAPVSLTFTGISGGSTPAAQSSVLKNSGTAPLNWSSAPTQAWCQVTPTSGSLAVGASTTLSITVSPPTNEGSFTCPISIIDSTADNSPQAVTVTYTVGPVLTDTQAPTVSTINPTNNSVVAKKAKVAITVSASDNKAVTKVEFLVNNSVVCTDTTGTYSCLWKVPAAPNKTYTISTKAYDAAGNVGNSAQISVTAK